MKEKTKSPNDSLDEAIAVLELKRKQELIDIKLLINELHESLKPVNIIKDTLKSVTASSDIKNGIGKTALGVASGLIVKNVFFRKSFNPLKIISGIVLQTITTGIVAKNSDKISSTAQSIFHALRLKFKHKKSVEPK